MTRNTLIYLILNDLYLIQLNVHTSRSGAISSCTGENLIEVIGFRDLGRQS